MIELLWNAPTSEESMSRHIEVLDLPASSRILDVGCGCGEFLIRVCERFKTTGTGIDISEPHIEEAKRRASARVPAAELTFDVADAQRNDIVGEPVDLAVCMGSTHAFGGGPSAFENALQRLRAFVKPTGMVLVADGYMKRPADSGYRKLLGDSMPDSKTHATNVAIGRACGLVPLAAWTSSEEEWDNFEWGYQRIVEHQAERSPDDLQIAAKLARRREWMDAYLRFGRDTLGYGTYLFKKPAT